jgi:hypothetical protein
MTMIEAAAPTPGRDILQVYARQSAMSAPGAHAALFADLPRDRAALCVLIQGLLLHEHLAGAYGVTLSPERHGEAHIRSVEGMLTALRARSDAPLTAARDVDTRLIGVCRHFSLLMAAMMRSQGVPARARCGFAGYFEPGQWVDHWVCEIWDDASGRWVLVDAQLDERQRTRFSIDFDPLDTPRDRFLVAGDGWARCRDGAADPGRFGIMAMHGLWFVAGNLVRDAAALMGHELLPWDVWGAMPAPDAAVPDDVAAFLDRVAALTRSPDAGHRELRALFDADPRLTTPPVVFNAVRGASEAV